MAFDVGELLIDYRRYFQHDFIVVFSEIHRQLTCLWLYPDDILSALVVVEPKLSTRDSSL